MTIQRVNGRSDYWNANHKIGGKQYSVNAPTLDKAIEAIFKEMEKDGHQLTAIKSGHYCKEHGYIAEDGIDPCDIPW